MATFLPGVTDIIPQIQPWQPNYNFYENVRGRKQQQFDKGWNQVNNVYNSILNAPMMRSDNNETRDEYFDNIKNEIHKIAGVDLSLQQNVQLASQIFEPFYNDDGIVKDMAFTKNFQDENKRAENLRRCTDIEKCGDEYWEGGVRLMQYQAQDFVNASAEDALGISNVKYVPNVNFTKEATKAAKEAGLSVTYDEIGDGWITTYKNGQALQQPLMNYFMSRFGNDPRLKDFNYAQAGLMLRENPNEAAEIYKAYINNTEISEEAAKAQVKNQHAQNQYQSAKKDVQTELSFQEGLLDFTTKQKDLDEQIVREEGVPPGTDAELSFEEIIRAQASQEVIVENLNNTNKVIENTDGLITQFGIEPNMRQVQSIIANSLLMKDMYMAAETLSYKDASITRKVDPYAMERTKQANKISLANAKNKRDDRKALLDLEVEIAKLTYASGVKDGTISSGGLLMADPTISIWDKPKALIATMSQNLDDSFSGTNINRKGIEAAVKAGNYELADKLATENTHYNNGSPTPTDYDAVRIAEMNRIKSSQEPIEVKEEQSWYTMQEAIESIATDDNTSRGIDLGGVTNKSEKVSTHKAYAFNKVIAVAAADVKNLIDQNQTSADISKYAIATDLYNRYQIAASDGNSIESQDSRLEMRSINGQILHELNNQYGMNRYNNYDDFMKSLPKKDSDPYEGSWMQGITSQTDGTKTDIHSLTKTEFEYLKSAPTIDKNRGNDNARFNNDFKNAIPPKRMANIVGSNNLFGILNGKTKQYINPRTGNLEQVNK